MGRKSVSPIDGNRSSIESVVSCSWLALDGGVRGGVSPGCWYAPPLIKQDDDEETS